MSFLSHCIHVLKAKHTNKIMLHKQAEKLVNLTYSGTGNLNIPLPWSQILTWGWGNFIYT
jgi:hypothetical protein